MKKVTVGILLVISSLCLAQKTTQDQRIWFSYFGQYKISGKWGFHVEAQLRTDNDLHPSFQNLYRGGVIYYLSAKEHVTLGYALIHTLNLSLDEYANENRLWEQYQFNYKWDKNIMTHRLRAEQRWVEQLPSERTVYQNRLRYLNRNLIHLMNLNSEQKELYLVLQDEIFLILGDNRINTNFMDQNRFQIGVGLNNKSSLRLELGYMNQYITSSSGNNSMNHIVSINVFHNLDFQKH